MGKIGRFACEYGVKLRSGCVGLDWHNAVSAKYDSLDIAELTEK